MNKKFKASNIEKEFEKTYNQCIEDEIPTCPRCFKPMKLDKENSGKYNQVWSCCGLGFFKG